MPLSRKTSSIARIPQIIDVELFHRFGLGLVMVAVHPESPPRQTTEDGSPADPANGLTDESVGKPSSPSGQTVDIGCLGQGMTVATEGARSLVIGEEKDDIGALRVRLRKD